MKFNRNINYYLRLREARLKDLRKTHPFIDGSLVDIPHTCGNPRCKCAKGSKHRGYYLTSKDKGRTRTQYVPVGMYEAVKSWTIEYRVLKHLIKEINIIQRMILRRYVKEKGRKAIWDKN
jgi:hypothetical protein